jgi:hypothetical protein
VEVVVEEVLAAVVYSDESVGQEHPGREPVKKKSSMTSGVRTGQAEEELDTLSQTVFAERQTEQRV